MRHDPAERPSGFGEDLVFCVGSLVIVDLPVPRERLPLNLALDDEDEQAEQGITASALY
ncbi:hypothetical protein [Streptomyces coeruleorubidus]|uniref:hypothetical protein n=1 Tax=Streptomyces coeruleorubidus TaxID=116188 RepID=UPI0036A8B29B